MTTWVTVEEGDDEDGPLFLWPLDWSGKHSSDTAVRGHGRYHNTNLMRQQHEQ